LSFRSLLTRRRPRIPPDMRERDGDTFRGPERAFSESGQCGFGYGAYSHAILAMQTAAAAKIADLLFEAK
jgi:hypothetical protein